MLKTRIRRLEAETERVLDRFAAVKASVAAIGDENLLDLADIPAAGEPPSPRRMAAAAMRRRKLGA